MIFFDQIRKARRSEDAIVTFDAPRRPADVRVGPAGAWEWASDKPELHRAVRELFYRRNEDGAQQRGGYHARAATKVEDARAARRPRQRAEQSSGHHVDAAGGEDLCGEVVAAGRGPHGIGAVRELPAQSRLL